MSRAFLLVLVVAGVFVWTTCGDLPPVVASHFDASGTANGFMSSSNYRVFVLVFVVAIPALLGFSGQLVRLLPPQLINLPHREYWLAPQRKAATIESLSSMTLVFAFFLVAFMCFVHWLVVQANATQPVRLAQGPFLTGVGLLIGATVIWLVVVYRRFGRVP